VSQEGTLRVSHFHAQVGRRKFAARAESLPPEEAEERMVRYLERVPRYARAVMSLGGLKANTEAEIRALARQMLMFAIKPA